MSELEATPPKQKGLIQDSNQLRNSMASCLFRSAGNAVAFNGKIAARFMSTSGNVKDMGGAFKDRESAAENAYFNKEEHAKLEALVKKLRRQIEPTADEQSVDRKSLQTLLSQHKVAASDSLVADLMKWRFGK